MKLEKAKLVTIIADEAIESKIIEELHAVAVKGFTVTEARGEGLNQNHNSSWGGKEYKNRDLGFRSESKSNH